MDEIEFKQTYDLAAASAMKITAPETKEAVALCLQMIHFLQERITEMQEEIEDE
jgi:hypothetical protein